MATPISYIIFQDEAGGTINIPTVYKPTNPGCIAVGTNGLFVPGENDSEARERTYSNGSVLPHAPRYKGRDFSVTVAFYQLPGRPPEAMKELFQNVSSFLMGKTLTLACDFPLALTVQTQRIDLKKQVWRAQRSYLEAEIFFKAAEA